MATSHFTASSAPGFDATRICAIFRGVETFISLDHGLRIISGQAEGNMPAASAQLELLNELVRRWTPDHLHDQPLLVEFAQIQHRTREYFNRLFGG